MSEFKGTKGKLSIVEKPYKHDGEYQGVFKIVNEKGKFFGSTDCYDFRGQSFEEMHANATLIAHAPQMLEMLNELIEDLEGEAITSGVNDTIRRAKQLIQQATTIK